MDNYTIFHFQKIGLWTTVQDSGRNGFQASGVPVSGVMDKFSAQIANELVGNSKDSPVLEITLFGPTITVEGTAIIAITGANLSAIINGQNAQLYQSILLKNGDQIAFGKPKNGCRAYLAITGEWQIKTWLQSTSFAPQNGKILTPDSFFQKGSQLRIKPNLNVEKSIYPKVLRPKYTNLVRIRVMKGSEFDLFPEVIRHHFFGNLHEISPNFNRMGIQLTTLLEDFKPNQVLISSGIVPGTIQITNAGQPIILMKDAQTTGGYWRIGNVISEDLNKLAQVKGGDKIWVSLV